MAISCGIQAHREKLKRESDQVEYTDNLAHYFAKERGVNPRDAIQKDGEINEKGYWIRQVNYFTTPFGDKEGQLKAEKDRYTIYWTYLCNWSNRPVLVRDILGLQDVIDEVVVDKTGETNVYGWGFPYQESFRDKKTDAYFLAEFYKNADVNYKGRSTTPTLVDTITKKAVNNDYHRLTNYIEVNFRKFQKEDAPDLYPVKYRKEIDEFNDWLFPHVNNGHYRQAFTNNIEVYDESQNDFHNALEKLDKRLSENRFLFGDYITDSDIRLYVTLIKWETDFYVFVGPQKKRINEYKNLWEYVKELYNIDSFKKYTNLPKKPDDTKARLTYLDKISFRNFDEWLKTDGSRKKLSSDPDNLFLKHKDDETIDDYITPISASKWNNKDQESRADWDFKLSTDPAINPLKGLLKNN